MCVGNTVRAEVERLELPDNHGEGGVAMRISHTEQTVSFPRDAHKNVQANLNRVMVLDPMIFSRRQPLKRWRLDFTDKLSMLLDLGMHTSDPAWPLAKRSNQPERTHLSYGAQVPGRSFHGVQFKTYTTEVPKAFFQTSEEHTPQRYKSRMSGLRITFAKG